MSKANSCQKHILLIGGESRCVLSAGHDGECKSAENKNKSVSMYRYHLTTQYINDSDPGGMPAHPPDESGRWKIFSVSSIQPISPEHVPGVIICWLKE